RPSSPARRSSRSAWSATCGSRTAGGASPTGFRPSCPRALPGRRRPDDRDDSPPRDPGLGRRAGTAGLAALGTGLLLVPTDLSAQGVMAALELAARRLRMRTDQE